MHPWTRVATTILDELGDRVAAQGYPSWVEVVPDPDDHLDIRMRPVDRLDLFGWTAPVECLALGVVATATLHREDGPVEPSVPVPRGRTRGARLACVVGRDRQVGWLLRLPDGSEIDRVPEEGRLLDCMRRCLGLPTAPPPATPASVQTALWLSAIIEEGEQSDRLLSWEEVLNLHPVVEAAGDCCRGLAITEREIPELIRISGAAWPWDRLRRDTLVNHWAEMIVPDELAEWMDDGMFARWVLAALPAPEELVLRLRRYVAPSLARRIAHAVRTAA